MKKGNYNRSPPNNQEDKLGDNVGRWTQQQHRLFVTGYNQYGKNWKSIANLIKTRTSSQVRSHAQKYFYRIEKDNSKDNPLIIHEPRKLRTRNRHNIHRANNLLDPPTPTFCNNFQRYPNIIIAEQPQAEQEQSLEKEVPQIANIPNIAGQIVLSFFMEHVYPLIATRGWNIQSLIQIKQNRKPQQILQQQNIMKNNRSSFIPYNP